MPLLAFHPTLQVPTCSLALASPDRSLALTNSPSQAGAGVGTCWLVELALLPVKAGSCCSRAIMQLYRSSGYVVTQQVLDLLPAQALQAFLIIRGLICIRAFAETMNSYLCYYLV